MEQIKLRDKYRKPGVVKGTKGGTNQSGASKAHRGRRDPDQVPYDPSKHVLILGKNGRRRWEHAS